MKRIPTPGEMFPPLREVQPTSQVAHVEEKALEGNDWPEPSPLPDDLLPVEPFDFALLPDTLRPWAADICERIQCPGDFVAVGIMSGLGAVVGRKVGIRPQAKTDWTVTANQWGGGCRAPRRLEIPGAGGGDRTAETVGSTCERILCR